MLAFIDALKSSQQPTILIEVAGTKGSAPREQGAFMLVTASTQCGTIGGGQLEYMAIAHAHAMLQGKSDKTSLDIALGPEIGQCCGGRAGLTFRHTNNQLFDALTARLSDNAAHFPAVYIFGAGHTGRALARALSLLPLRVIAVECRAQELESLPANVQPRLEAMPESIVSQIEPGASVVILTHDHALDFLIAAESLKRTDLAYVGMIGSATKRATFTRWIAREHEGVSAQLLTTPIGGSQINDKRPEVIAALTTAEVLHAIAAWQHREALIQS